ncbi:MAG: SMP-30/gluconolactonase/LRE family protein [Actinomycetes bacterium]
MTDVAVERLALGVFELGESPHWDAATGLFSWVDITPGRLHTFSHATGMHEVFDCGQPVGVARPRVGGGYVCGLREGVALAAPRNPPAKWVARGFVPDTHRLNDGVCDARGRLWVGATALEFGSRPGSLYRVEPDGDVRVAIDGVQFPNGIGFSPDGSTMYLVDTLAWVLLAYDFDADAGQIANGRRLVVFDQECGIADGLAVDREGGLWVARYGAGAVERYDADGELTERIALPASQVTAPAFGDEDMATLYVTSAWQFLTADARDENQGAVFTLRPGVAGAPAHSFAG